MTQHRPTTVVITMAGRGQRFRDRGYDVPKYEITVRGKTLFAWAMESLQAFIDAGSPFVFLTRREDAAGAFLASACAAMGIGRYDVIELPEVTDGQARTALLAAPCIADPEAPLLVYNIDTHVRPGLMTPADVRGDGWLPCFPGPGQGWSFARTDATGRVVELREKQRISDHATVGLYWFSSFSLYASLFEAYYGQPGNEEMGEKYIAPMYNHMIAQDRPVFIQELPLDAVVPLGTPDEVAAFERGNGGFASS